MIDLMLRFTSEDEAIEALSAYRGPDGWVYATHGHALDVIGAVERTTPIISPETGDVVVPAIVDNRFHVNLRIIGDEHSNDFEEYRVNPPQPARVWAS